MRTRALPAAAVLGVVALLMALVAVATGPSATASPTASGRFVYAETLDRGDTFRVVLTDSTGAVERVLAPRSYGRPAISPDGSQVAYSAPVRESLGRYALFVAATDGSGSRQVTSAAVGDFDPAWSPDGSRIVYSRDERGSFEPSCCTLWTMRADGSDPLRLDAATSAKQPDWSPDGAGIAYTAPDGVRLIGSTGGPSRLVAQGALSWPAFSPDGGTLAVVRRTGPESGTVSVVPVGGGPLGDTAAGVGGGLPEAPRWADASTLLHLNAWGQGENGRTRAEVRSTVVGGGSSVLFSTGRPMYYLHWWGWRVGQAQAQPRGTDQACPGDVPPAGFDDVPPGGTHSRAVDCVVHWGVARGRTGSQYAPAEPVRRDQMATFLAGFVVQSGGTLPEPTRDHFDDDDGLVHEDAINRLAEAGVVRGRADGSYGPGTPVSRAQMAALLARGYDERARQADSPPLPAGEDWFYDDTSSPLHDDVNRIASAGFAGGVGGGRYAPGAPVRRDQMASFVARALDLLVERQVAAPPA